MAFDPEKEGAVAVFNPAAEGAVEVGGPTIAPNQDVKDVSDRAGMVYDTAIEDNISINQADKYFYSTASTQKSIEHDFYKDPPPDNRTGFSEEWISQWTGVNLATKVPIVGGVIGGLESLDLIWAANRLSDPKFDYDKYNRKEDAYATSVGVGPIQMSRTRKQLRGPSSRSRESDKAQVIAAVKDATKERTFGGKVAQGVSALPTWMIEFAATGGLASLGDDAAKKAGEKILRKYTKTLAGKAAIKSGRLVTGAVVRTSTGLLPRVGEKAVARQAMIEIGISKNEGWATSLAKAWGDVAIESFSEETGGLLTRGAGRLLDKLPFGKRYIEMLKTSWVEAGLGTTDDFASKVFTKTGYSNILAEMGEERIGTLLREATSVSDRKGEWGERIWSGMQEDFTLENLGVELITLLAPAAAKRGMTIGQSLTKGVDVPTEAEQLNQAIDAGKVEFDSTEDAQGFADKAAEVAQREGVDVTINTDMENNSVTVERVKAGQAGITKEGEDFSDFFDFQESKPEIIAEEKGPQTIKEMKEDAYDAIFSDPVFQIEEEALDIQTRQVDVGVYAVPENLKGEIKKAIEDDPSLRFSISTTGKGTPYDVAVQEGLLQRTAGSEGEIDIEEFLGMVAQANKAKKKIGGVSEILLDKMIASGQPYSEIDAIKHKMLHSGFTISEINEAVQDIGTEYDIDVNDLILKEKDRDEKSRKVPEGTQAAKEITSRGIKKVRKSLAKARKVIPKIKAEQKAERKKRVGAAAGALKSNVKKGTPTDEAIFRSTGLLKGQLTDYEQRYEPIEDQLTGEEKNALYDKIRSHPGLQYFDIVNTATSLKKLLGGVALTDGDVKNIKKVFGKSFVSDNGKDILAERQEVSSFYDKAVALWKAGLLTGIKTSGLNTLSNMAHSISESAATLAGVPVDKTAALFTGKRALAFTTKGTKEGVIRGLKSGWNYMKTGESERDIGKKLDYTKVNFGTGKIARGLQVYEETIFHLLGAEDQPFYYGAKARSIASQAIAQGKTLGLKGKSLKDHVDSVIQNPTDDMLVAAVHDAEVAVFQNRTVLGDIARGIQNVPGGEIVVPFGRTPSAVATQIIHYSPVGIVSEVAGQIKKGEFNQRKFSQAFGRSIVGTGVLYIGSELLKAGLLTLDYPDDEKERRLWELEGRKENSIKIGNKWRSIQVLGPIGNGLVIGGHFQKAFEDEGSPTKAIAKAMGKSAKSFTEQTFTTGIKKAVDALTNPERSAEEWFESMAGSLVPTIVSDIARATTDNEVRQDGAIQRIQSRIPGLRGKLPSKLDVFGQDLPRYGGNVLEVMLDPSRPVKIRNDVVVDELRKLSDDGLNVTSTLLGGKDGFDILTDEENTQMWRRQGDLTYRTMQAFITSEGYKNITNNFAKKEKIEEIITKTRAAARAEMAAIKLSQGFTIVELAESGLLTIEEFDAIKYFTK